MKGERVTVTSTATAVAGASVTNASHAGPGSASYPTAALVRVPSGAPTVYFGGQAVTINTGCPLVAGEDLVIDLVNEILYGVCSTSAVVYVLRRGD